ncbi:TRAP transporter small permease [Cohaesibacter celericrescens]|nr:TRAP transporter small permease [Cohaesibacter celericrescens]
MNTGQKPFLGTLKRAEDTVMSFMKWILILAMSGMVGVVFLQIVSRYAFSFSLGWSEEVARLLFICITFLGAAVLARKEDHLKVTVITDMLPERAKHFAALFATSVALICGRFLVEGGWETMVREWDQRTPSLQFPMGIVFLIIFLSVCLLTLWLFVNFLIHLNRFVVGEKPEELS